MNINLSVWRGGVRPVSTLLLLGILTGVARGQATLTVQADQPGHKIPSTLWGVFFEDINLSADGGIYPELVRNRSFEDADKAENWMFASTGGGNSEAAVVTADVHGQPVPLNAFNRRSLRIRAGGTFTLQNEGYWGMNFVAGDRYRCRFAVRSEGYTGGLKVRLLSAAGGELASGQTADFSQDWKYQEVELTPTGSDAKGKLELAGEGNGTLYLDMVSLLPEKTWKGHGLRADLAGALDALHPKFVRFPGGCWVEGDDFAHMNHWKNTIGNIDTRTPLWNIWGYYSTHGLGFYEYLQLAEDLGATPLFDINVGMSHKETVPLDRMGQWVQDALDAVEYANGPVDSVWGSQRAAAGHPAPFNLKYMEIGNENGGAKYAPRWALLVNALRAKYPDLKFIVNSDLGGGPYPRNPRPDIVDEHYYESPEAFMRRAEQYDTYDRKGPKIFVGEYAVTQNAGQGNLRAAIGEAAFMTGMERNSDVVEMASYAPLLVNLNHRAWNPDLISFDSSRWYGIPSYHVQKLFSNNRGDETLPVTVDSPVAVTAPASGQVGVGTWNTAAEFKDIKVTAPDGRVLFASGSSPGGEGWKLLGDGADWSVQGGVLRQGARREFIRALAGDRHWTDYTLELKARKLSGAEGFLILFRVNGDEDRVWWNLGGWGNTQDAIEAGGTIDAKPGHIDTGRWYDLKVTVAGANVKCWCDGELVHDVDYLNVGSVKSLYATAAKDDRTGEVILKLVNASVKPLDTRIQLNGAAGLTGQGTATVLTSENGTDENTIDEPEKVAPKTGPVTFTGTVLTRTLPGNSFTVLRLGGKP